MPAKDPMQLVIANDYGETDRLDRHHFYMSQAIVKDQISRKLSCHITKNHQLVKDAVAKKMVKFDWKNTKKTQT